MIVNRSEIVFVRCHNHIHCWQGEQKDALAQAQLTCDTRRHRYACSNHIPVLSLDMSMVASILFLYVCMHAEC